MEIYRDNDYFVELIETPVEDPHTGGASLSAILRIHSGDKHTDCQSLTVSEPSPVVKAQMAKRGLDYRNYDYLGSSIPVRKPATAAIRDAVAAHRERTAKLAAQMYADIPGLREIEAATAAVANYHESFNRAMEGEMESSSPPTPPTVDRKALYAQYPRAVAFLQARANSRKHVGSTYGFAAHNAGKVAMRRLRHGDDIAVVMAEMEAEIAAASAKAAWC